MGIEEKQPLLGSINDDGDILVDNKPKNVKSTSVMVERFKNIIRKSMTKDTIQVLIYVLLYVSSGVVNSVLLKKVMIKFVNYGFFLSQLTNYGYMPIFYLAMAYKLYFTNDVPPEQRAFPQYKFVIMGLLDALNGFFVVIGGISTSGSLQQLLNQAIIPFTMIASFIFLKERYSLIQLGGSLIIIGGVVVSLIPSLIGGGTSGNILFYNLFYLISVIPGALSNVYKDIAFSDHALDIYYLQFWDCLYQSFFGSVLFPINNWLPPPATIKFSSIPSAMKDGALCLAGINTLVPTYNTTTGLLLETSCGVAKDIICDDCERTWVVVLMYMLINIAYNIFILLVLKHAGATVYSIANTLILPLTNIAFSIRPIMGTGTTPFSGLSIAGLMLILSGLGSYRVGSMIKKKPDPPALDDETKTGLLDDEVVPKQSITPKSHIHLRNQFFGKLGLDIPESRYRAANIINEPEYE